MEKVQDAFQEIYEKYYKDIYRFLLKWTSGNSLLSEELTQETFYQAFLSMHRYRGECNIKTWICRIAINTACKYYDKTARYVETGDFILGESKQNVEDTSLHKEELQWLRASVRQLKPKYRDVVIYRIYLELSFREIGKMMNISENSAKVLFHRAKEMLRKELN